MTFPDVQLDLVTELFLNDDWADVSADVWLGADVTTTHGRPNESGQVAPSTCSLTLRNSAGNYSPRNPLGAYFGSLGRNTPIRVAIRHITDAFTRTVSNGWGSTPSGLAWTAEGTASNYAVTGTAGTHAIAAATTSRRTYLAGLIGYQNYEVRVGVSISPSTPASGQCSAGVMLRGQSPTGPVNYAVAEVDVTSAGVVRVAIRDSDDTTYLVSPTTVAGVTAGDYSLAAQVEGRTIRVKVWNTGQDEPYEWQATAESDDMARAGWLGIRSRSGTSAASTTYTYDNLEIRSPRFFGEVSSWPPRWDQSANRPLVPIEAGGILRRLGQGASPLQSAPRRYIPSTAAVAYWPLEEGKLSAGGQPVVGSDPMVLTSNLAPAQHFGKGDLGAVLNPGVAMLGDDDTLTGHVDMAATFVDEWAVDLIRSGGSETNSRLNVETPNGTWYVNFLGSSSSVEIVRPNADGSVGVTSYPTLFDGSPHHVRFVANQNGSAVDTFLNVDSAVASAGTGITAFTLDEIISISFVDFGAANHSDALAVAHFTVYAEGRPLVDFARPVLGWIGETAGERIERLCDEENIPFSRVGDLADSATMGAQTPAALVDLLNECAGTDMGALYEPRGALGIGYRTRRSLENQEAALALDLEDGDLAAPIEPIDDDQATRNQVTAQRKDGGSYKVEQATGPLSTLDPQDGGVGRYDVSVTVNPETDDALPDIASWLVHLGTVDESRYPQIKLNLAHAAYADSAAMTAAVLGLGVEDRVTVDGLSALDIYDQVSQLVRGVSESLNAYKHEVTINCAPESPYHTMVLDDADLGRLGSDTTALNEDLTTSETGADVAITDGVLWTTDAGQMPFDVKVGGERMTVTAITGASSPQTLTVTRTVNGVTKTHSTGAAVKLFDPVALAL